MSPPYRKTTDGGLGSAEAGGPLVGFADSFDGCADDCDVIRPVLAKAPLVAEAQVLADAIAAARYA